MNLQTAIKILQQDLEAKTYDNFPGLYEAQKLGIEALKRIEKLRTGQVFSPSIRLPGETED